MSLYISLSLSLSLSLAIGRELRVCEGHDYYHKYHFSRVHRHYQWTMTTMSREEKDDGANIGCDNNMRR